ncbi:FxSxx-COOH system tetratricopeptide repeat protein [Streptosporangium sp. NPDC023615]|uniref:FxSxx-COOH system tetratricopeptide repeat protein n=1 Tax=Streptosporangium sp. NPDC023615 TaxID=3154794 RepID=UPI00341F94CF
MGGDNLGIISTGDHTTNTQTVLPEQALRPVEEVSAPPGLVNLPFHAQLFVGRGEELAELERALSGAGPAVVVAAVHGLGGIGKSTLAARYAAARARAGAVNPVWWITADTPGSIEAGLAGLAVALQPELKVLPAPVLAQRAVSWLACHQDWLLVLDNLTHPRDASELLARTLAGRVLVTSRLGEGWHRVGAQVLRLDVLPEDQAIDLLTRITTGGRPGADLDGAAELVRELGCLPLAIEQAGAYLHQNQLSPRAYLELLARYPAVMYDQAAEGGDAERTIARIWRLTLNQLTTTPLAGDLLRVLAWYAPQAIPAGVLDALAEPPRLRQALGRLAAYNMITLDGPCISVHRLVQAVARTPDPDDPHREDTDIATAREHATRLLTGALPTTAYNDPAGWPTWRTLLPHITALIDHAPSDTDTLDTARLLNGTGLFLFDQGNPAGAIRCHHRAHTAYHRVLGGDHPSTLASRSNLAGAYYAAGDLGRAIPLLQATLAESERVLGGDHPFTLTSRSNLAGAYGSAGDLGRAIPLLQATLAESERVLGGDHPSTLTTRNNLAGAYYAAGDLGRAIPLFEATLAERERVLGGDHPSTLASRSNLAGAYYAAGDLGRAIPLLQATLAESERVLGGDHPSTLTTRNNLAHAYESAGDLGQAIPLLQATLAESERVLGGDHPSTLTTRNNLAHAYYAAGDLGRAIPLFEATLAERERVLGGDHPDTLTTRNNLAGAYYAAGDLGRAIPLFEATLAESERVLGGDHPLTQMVRGNLIAAKE